MAMVMLSAARRHHRSRISYACGLLALVGVATALVVLRDPAHSSTVLTTPVPLPASDFPPTGAEPTGAPPDGGRPVGSPAIGAPADPGVAPFPVDRGVAVDADTTPTGPAPRGVGPEPGVGGGTAALTDAEPSPAAHAVRPGPARAAFDTPHHSLFWSGLLGLSISLTGLIMVGRRRRMW